MILRKGIHESKKNNKVIMNNIFANQHKYSFPYFAGWADGDGCFKTKNKHKLCYALLILNEEPVFQLSNLYKSSVTLSTPEKREWINTSGERKQTSLAGQRLIHFCKSVAPFLIEKQIKALEILKIKNIENYNCSFMEHDKKQFTEYLAGFLEAEGHFRYSQKYKQYGIKVSNYNETVIKFIKDNLKNFYNIEINYRKTENSKMTQGPNGKKGEVYTPSQKYIYSLIMGGQKSRPILKKILPFMTIDYKINSANKIINHKYRGENITND